MNVTRAGVGLHVTSQTVLATQIVMESQQLVLNHMKEVYLDVSTALILTWETTVNSDVSMASLKDFHQDTGYVTVTHATVV